MLTAIDDAGKNTIQRPAGDQCWIEPPKLTLLEGLLLFGSFLFAETAKVAATLG